MAGAYLEYIDEFGNLRHSGDRRAMARIAKREQDLTQNMTAASRQGYEQLPFMQFMTYTTRINEAIFAGTLGGKSVLTGREKLKLALTHGVLFGGASFAGTSFLMDRITSRYGNEADTETVDLMRRGALDYLVSEISGADTALASRLSSGDGLVQTVRGLVEDNWWETAVGPSGEFTGRAFDALLASIKLIYTDTPEAQLGIAKEKLARLTSTGNYVFNTYEAITQHRYLSRNGSVISDDISTAEATFIAFGLPIAEIDNAYRLMAQVRLDDNLIKVHARHISELFNRLHNARAAGEEEEMLDLARAIGISRNSKPVWFRAESDKLVERYMSTLPFTDQMLMESLIRQNNSGE